MEGELQQELELCFHSLALGRELGPKPIIFGVMTTDVLLPAGIIDLSYAREISAHSENLLELIEELVKNDEGVRYFHFVDHLFGLEIAESLNAFAESSSLCNQTLASEATSEIHPICCKTGGRDFCKGSEKDPEKNAEAIMIVKHTEAEEKDDIGWKMIEMRQLNQLKEDQLHQGRKAILPRRKIDDYESGMPAREAAVDSSDSSFPFLMSLILAVSVAILCLLPLSSSNKKFTESLHFGKAGPLNSMRVLAGALMMAAVTSLLALDAMPRRPAFARSSGFVAVFSGLFALAMFLPAFFLGAMFAFI